MQVSYVCQVAIVALLNNCDREGRVRLNTIAALRSLDKSQIAL